jgi:hypothetical protein
VRIDPSLSTEYYPALFTNTNTFLDLISDIYHPPITAAVATTIVVFIAIAINTRITILKLLEFSY